MRTYQVNPKGEKLYELECSKFDCRYSDKPGIIKLIWSKGDPNIKCDLCGSAMIETNRNWYPMPQLDPKTEERFNKFMKERLDQALWDRF